MLAAAALPVGLTVTSTDVPSAAADDCPDTEVIFARGTDEPVGTGEVGQAFIDSLRQDTGKNVAVYAVNYKASLLQLHWGDGAKDAISQIKSFADKCPDTPLVLGGYSQGAAVMDIVTGVPVGGINFGNSLPPQYANKIAAVATFGNPADRSGGPISAQSQLFGSKAIDMCNPSDPICHAGPGNQWSGHTDGYVPGYTTQAANFVATKLWTFGPFGPRPGPDLGPNPGPGLGLNPVPTGGAVPGSPVVVR